MTEQDWENIRIQSEIIWEAYHDVFSPSKILARRRVRKNDILVDTVYATRDIDPGVVLGIYPGKFVADGKEVNSKYNISASSHVDTIKGPVDLHAVLQILEEEKEAQHILCQICEPSPGQYANTLFVGIYGTFLVTVVTTAYIRKGEEVLIHYGQEYERDYPISYHVGFATKNVYKRENVIIAFDQTPSYYGVITPNSADEKYTSLYYGIDGIDKTGLITSSDVVELDNYLEAVEWVEDEENETIDEENESDPRSIDHMKEATRNEH